MASKRTIASEQVYHVHGWKYPKNTLVENLRQSPDGPDYLFACPYRHGCNDFSGMAIPQSPNSDPRTWREKEDLNSLVSLLLLLNLPGCTRSEVACFMKYNDLIAFALVERDNQFGLQDSKATTVKFLQQASLTSRPAGSRLPGGRNG